MDLYLIRHGETVDNVAGIYAGVRDSALTNHGIEQARRLGNHLAKSGVRISYLFASPLSRAFKTAQSIQKAQHALPHNQSQNAIEALDIVRVADLIEQDFGFYEGKPFSARSGAGRSKNETTQSREKDQLGFVDVESKESLAQRADAFIDCHLLPLFEQAAGRRQVVAIVSHGILLTHLWRSLLRRLPRRSVTSQEVISNTLEHLGGWSNTGYLHLSFMRQIGVPEDSETRESSSMKSPTKADDIVVSKSHKPDSIEPVAKVQMLQGWLLDIVSIDKRDHLVGLKRQRGGIGSLAHDEEQAKLQTFFKRQRTI